MKKYYFIMLLITLILLTGQICFSKVNNESLDGKVVIIDPGHGGKDAGTSVGSVLEKDINLKISLLLKKRLEEYGVNVIMTRDGDYDLSNPKAEHRKKSDFDNRIELINSSDADMYLSIHINYLDDLSVNGIQTFYTNDNEELAKVIQDGFKSDLGTKLDEKKISDKIYMFKQLKIDGVLIECGFLGNNNDRRLLLSNEYHEKIVNSIIKSLLRYYS